MGIPGFYRWISEMFPYAVVDVEEDSPSFVNGVEIPVDTTKPNPNGVEFDNLYLDMNNIIHPCFHPENLASPKSYDEVFKSIFKYIDRMFSLIRPRKLLYMAIDGVAPRAKMNQQRARRFKTAKDVADELIDGCTEGRAASVTAGLDSNVITPGTEFMELLSSALKYYINLRMNHDSGWQGIKVILSDASVPGEGEHKILSYIRLQRNLPGFDPNTRHCLYGLDADLIMLGLATHEVHFSVLREVVRKRKAPKTSNKTEGRKLKHSAAPYQHFEALLSSQKFQFLNLWMLRAGLAEHLKIMDRTVKVDTERLIDDFVLMCIFVGNDFLPNVPSLEITEGAISLLIRVYKKEFVRMGGYLTNSFKVNLERLEHFIQAIALHEDSILKNRKKKQKALEMRSEHIPDNVSAEGDILDKSCEKESAISSDHVNKEARIVVDKVNLGEGGWKERYYNEKFEVQTDEERTRVKKHAVVKYAEGISWVMHYYYKEVCSWQWFYPYHYAPFASDFHGLGQLKIQFSLGKPFKPFSQLMGVLPAASGQALPIFYRKLMIDPSSPILDFYPTDFELDLNCGKPAWQAICKLPFIDECRLLNEISKVKHTLTGEEKQRNTLGLDKLFVHELHPLATKLFTFSERNKDNPKLNKVKVKRKINPKFSGGMNGYIYISDKPICPAEVSSPICDMELIVKNKVLSVFYKFPSFHPHIPKPPQGVKKPKLSIGRHELLIPGFARHKKDVVQRRVAKRSLSTPRPLSMPLPPPRLKRPLPPTPHLSKPSGTNDKEGRKPKRTRSQKNRDRLKRRKLNENLASEQSLLQQACPV